VVGTHLKPGSTLPLASKPPALESCQYCIFVFQDKLLHLRAGIGASLLDNRQGTILPDELHKDVVAGPSLRVAIPANIGRGCVSVAGGRDTGAAVHVLEIRGEVVRVAAAGKPDLKPKHREVEGKVAVTLEQDLGEAGGQFVVQLRDGGYC